MECTVWGGCGRLSKGFGSPGDLGDLFGVAGALGAFWGGFLWNVENMFINIFTYLNFLDLSIL